MASTGEVSLASIAAMLVGMQAESANTSRDISAMRGEFGATNLLMKQEFEAAHVETRTTLESHAHALQELTATMKESQARIAQLENGDDSMSIPSTRASGYTAASNSRYANSTSSSSNTASSAAKKRRSSGSPAPSHAGSSASKWEQKMKAHGEDVKTLRFAGFPHSYPKPFLEKWTQELLLSRFPENIKAEKLHCGASARSLVIQFTMRTEAIAIMDNFSAETAEPIMFKDPDDGTMHKLSLKWNAPDEVRKMGTLLATLWQVTETTFSSLGKVHKTDFTLRTNRDRGHLQAQIVGSHRIIDLLAITYPPAGGDPKVVLNIAETVLPTWITKDILLAIAKTTMELDNFS